MDFAFTEEQQMIAETARGFFAANATSTRTREAMANEGIDRPLWSAFAQDLGLAGIGLSDEFGGAGLGMVEFAIVAEAAGTQVAAVPLLGLATAARGLAAGGSKAQQQEWVPRLAAGNAIAVFAEAPDLKSAGGKLNGEVRYVPHGALADLFVLATRDETWLVPLDASGVTVQNHVTLDQTRPLATLKLDRTVAERLDDSRAAAVAARQGGWLCLAAEALGGGQEALDRTVAYSKDRIQFGRPIGSFQAFKHRLADMAVAIEQARSAVYWGACALDETPSEAAIALHAAKSFCADAYFFCAANMLQLHGGIGFTWEHDTHLFFKRARSIQTLMGSSDWHREQVAASILEAVA